MESMELDLRQRDALGEMSNISMGSSATALSALLMNRRVEITTPQVEVIRRSRLMWRVSRFLKNFFQLKSSRNTWSMIPHIRTGVKNNDCGFISIPIANTKYDSISFFSLIR